MVSINNVQGYDPATSLPFTSAQVAGLRSRERRANVRDFGAIGGGIGTTVTQAGLDIVALRSETGQAWLLASDSMDLIAYYRALATFGSGAGSLTFPKDDYVFTAPGFLHSRVRVDLGGSTVRNTQTDATRFTRSNRVFLAGIFAREDFDRFDSMGFSRTCDDLALDARTITTLSGSTVAVGDVLLIRTTAASGSPTLPSYTTFNRVRAVAGSTVTLEWPMERAIASPKVVDYSQIVVIKQGVDANAVNAEPHRYYIADRVALTNGTLIATDGAAIEFNGLLDSEIDVQIACPTGQAVYGNGLNRSRVRVAGTFGGPKGPVEIAVGSALSRIDVDLRYSGVDANSSGAASGSYAHIQMGEYAEQILLSGKINAGNKPANSGVTFPTGNRNTVDVELVGRGIAQQAVVFASNSGTGNRVRGRYEISTLATYYALWSAGGAGDNWLEGAQFAGDQSSIHSLRFSGPTLGGARSVSCPEGQVLIDSTALGNAVTGYVREGIASAGPNGSIIDLQTAGGYWPEDRNPAVAYNTTQTLLAREAFGRGVTNTGATSIRTLTLPAGKAGMRVRAARNNATYALRIDPNATEIVGTGAAGKYLSLDSDGAFVDLRCEVDGRWYVVASVGTIGYEA